MLDPKEQAKGGFGARDARERERQDADMRAHRAPPAAPPAAPASEPASAPASDGSDGSTAPPTP